MPFAQEAVVRMAAKIRDNLQYDRRCRLEHFAIVADLTAL